MRTPEELDGPRTAIVLLNWNGWEDTVACAESLLRSDAQKFVVIICDNGSTDDSCQQLKTWGAATLGEGFAVWMPRQAWCLDTRVVLIQTGGNLGFAGGCNVGLRFALQETRCEYLWLLNNDTVVHPMSLAHQIRRMQQDPGLGLLGSTLIYNDQPETAQCFGGYGFNKWTARVRPLPFAPDPTHPPTPREVESRLRYVSGASTFTTRSFVEHIGLLNEQYFLYFEEIDWAVRGSSYRLGYCPESIVFHKEGRSIGSASSAQERSRQSERWLTRNRVLFIRTHFAARLPVTLLWVLAVALFRACTGRFGITGTLLQGLWQGLTAPVLPIPDLLSWPLETLQATQPDACAEDNLKKASSLSASLSIDGGGRSLHE